MTTEIAEQAGKLANALFGILMRTEKDPVIQQQAIELLMAMHANRMGNRREAMLVIDGLSKHAKQIVSQMQEAKA